MICTPTIRIECDYIDKMWPCNKSIEFLAHTGNEKTWDDVDIVFAIPGFIIEEQGWQIYEREYYCPKHHKEIK